MSKFKNILKELRKENNLTQDELSKKLGIAKSTISMYENGNREPDFETMEVIADFFNVDMGYLHGNTKEKNISSKSVSVPILNTVVAGLPLSAYEDVIGYEEVSRKLGSPDELFALKVKGDSMLPVLQEDDVIIVKQQSDVESGDIAIVLINGDEATVKKVMKSQDGITLIAFNPAVYEPHFYTNNDIVTLPIRIAGKVVEMKRSF